MRLRLRCDETLSGRLAGLRTAIGKNPGALPVLVDLLYPDGREVTIDLGEQFKVAVNLSFLSELDKLVPPSDASFGLDDRMSLEEREPPPWA